MPTVELLQGFDSSAQESEDETNRIVTVHPFHFPKCNKTQVTHKHPEL